MIYYFNIVPSVSYLSESGLDVNFLIKERERHDAYNSRSILRQLKTSSSRNTTNKNTIQPNKASHIVSYFTKNNNQEEHFVSQRTNRWKSARQTMAKTLANYNKEKSKPSRQLTLGRKHRKMIPQSKLY